MTAMTPVEKDSPLWLAWVAYTATPEYANTLKWATEGGKNVDGSLWAAFSEGFARAASPSSSPSSPETTPVPHCHECRVVHSGYYVPHLDCVCKCGATKPNLLGSDRWTESSAAASSPGASSKEAATQNGETVDAVLDYGRCAIKYGASHEIDPSNEDAYKQKMDESRSRLLAILFRKSAPSLSSQTGSADTEIKQLRGAVWALADTLARRCLADANEDREGQSEWPAGQSWGELVGSSQSIFRGRAYAEALLDRRGMIELLCAQGEPKPYTDPPRYPESKP